ncbi:endonuclease/exonuclease/phosphatase family protein [Nucisporomicrobium flavum]|jgi:endonuclease/exonuclease/phosphatase family metal-dependent hydrolase|uniref:endonuclease/exonuclease/phosphatase family protein n=1 Tax=Nucisporomicrobium flavum TaxID=2785915 RepID=UPI0018F59FDA|nr:endonuclease/exonuclease/phosphatase family protein [Nucisporomicrobium flavum]
MRLRVLTLNVQNEAGDPRRTPLLRREIARLRPDLVALQEVRRTGQLERLLAGTGLHATHQDDLIGPPPPGLDRFGGTVVATRRAHRVTEIREHREPGEAHWWTVAVAVDPGVLFVVPTTPWQPAEPAARAVQAAAVCDLLDRHRGRIAVVAGDLNAGPGEPGVGLLTGYGLVDAWTASGAGPGHTWTAGNPLAAAEMARLPVAPGAYRIDYVLAGPPDRVAVTAARLVGDRPVDGVWLSDHAGVLADLLVEPGPP